MMACSELRVLLVEDQRHMRGALRAILDSLGAFRVVAEFATEAEAKDWVKHHPHDWDLAVVDLVLDQGSGMGVIQRCRAARSDGVIIVLSSYASPGVHKHCLRLGADAVFDKGDTPGFTSRCAELVGGMRDGEPLAVD